MWCQPTRICKVFSVADVPSLERRIDKEINKLIADGAEIVELEDCWKCGGFVAGGSED